MHILEGTVGEQKKRAAVVVGRFSAPTIGHYAVFDAAKKFIRDRQDLRLDAVPIVVVVDGKETGKDKDRNPLSANERISFMKASGLADGIKFIVADSAFAAFEEVRKAGYEPIAVGAGSDRANKYIEMLDKYFKAKNDKKINHYAITLKRVSEGKSSEKIDKDAALDDILRYMGDDIPTNMVSASLARRAIKQNEFKKFTIISGLVKKPALAKKMFNKVKAAMAMETPDGS